MWFFIAEQWGRFALIFLSSIIWGLKSSLFPFFLKKEVDLLARGNLFYREAFWVFGVIAFLWILDFGVAFLQEVVALVAFPRLRSSIRMKLFSFTARHCHGYFSEHWAGTIAHKLAELPIRAQSMIEIFSYEFLIVSVAILGMMMTLWNLNKFFFAIFFSCIFLYFCILIFFLKRANPLMQEHASLESMLSGKVVDAITNIVNIKLFNSEKREYYRLQRDQKEEVIAWEKFQSQFVLMRFFFGINGFLGLLGLNVALFYSWWHHQATLGDFTQVSMQSFFLFEYGWYVAGGMIHYLRAHASVQSALSLIHQEQEVIDAPNAPALQVQAGEIVWDQVSFSYLAGKPIFQNLNVTIPAGQKVGLVGVSGAGKSTFVHLLLRLYDLEKGTICIDGESIASVTQASLRSAMAMIPQSPLLFHRSLMENIRYGRNDATDEEVKQAAQFAHCEEFILELEQGYDTLVGERGVKLSGGQRQRIAIARAFLKDAPILILDEATSSLDSITERKIQESLYQLMQGRTTLLIAHRLATLYAMDRILVFDQGKIIEDGSVEQLLAQKTEKKKGYFASLWELQYRQRELIIED